MHLEALVVSSPAAGCSYEKGLVVVDAFELSALVVVLCKFQNVFLSQMRSIRLKLCFFQVSAYAEAFREKEPVYAGRTPNSEPTLDTV